MQPLSTFQYGQLKAIFTDIDDTLTTHGKLTAEAYGALWALAKAGMSVIPVTGRPAGWCELIARQWPVHGVIGENGAFYFRLSGREMRRHFAVSEGEREQNRQKLEHIRNDVLKKIPGSALASDQFCRLHDLAIDFCEDVPPLPITQVKKIVEIFAAHGAHAKISSIHVNGWFGDYDKLTMCQEYARRELLVTDPSDFQGQCAFIGDSPNDEPMFAHFQNSFAVANISSFLDQLVHPPNYVTTRANAEGFTEFTQHILTLIQN